MYTEVLISGAIAVTLPIFSDNIFEVAIKKDEGRRSMIDNKTYEENAKRRFIYRITIGIIGLILAAYIQTPSTKWGVGIGSLIILISGLYGYWGKMTDIHKLLVSAIALIACVMISVRLYDVKSISDILNNPFGTIKV